MYKLELVLENKTAVGVCSEGRYLLPPEKEESQLTMIAGVGPFTGKSIAGRQQSSTRSALSVLMSACLAWTGGAMAMALGSTHLPVLLLFWCVGPLFLEACLVLGAG